LSTEQEKAGAIQAFEYTYELTWKTMRRLLQERGITIQSPRSTFREAGLEGLINNPETWMEFIKIRNITVHTYDEEEVQMVLSCLNDFSNELGLFLKNIGVPYAAIV
jgi:nucleotidyltransferase substrate binding protein (TIGR01987 family)